MTPADIARQNAITFECKKDALQQRQSGDWKISFTVQGIDMDERITRAAMGTRFMAVLVEINDDETPKEVVPNPRSQPRQHNATPQPSTQHRQAGAKRDWRELPPSQQAALRCGDAVFRAFLLEECAFDTKDSDQAAIVVRQLCKVESRGEFNSDPNAALRWFALDGQYEAWKSMERA